jgi:hypothetical protein
VTPPIVHLVRLETRHIFEKDFLMARYIKRRDGKFAGSIGEGKHRLPQEIRPVSHSMIGAYLENRTVRKVADDAASWVLGFLNRKYDAATKWKMSANESIPGVNDNDLSNVASMTKSKHFVDDWYGVCRKHKVEPMTPFLDIPKVLREQMALEMVAAHYRKFGGPYVGGM